MATVNTPDFNWSGFYYAEVLQDLRRYIRQNLPEINDEDPTEPVQQLLRAFALAMHNCNVYLDMVAKERFIPTASLRESVRAQLALIGVQLRQATPASGMLLLELAQPFGVESVAVPALARFATESGDSDGIVFEILDGLTVTASNVPEFVKSYDASLGTWTAHTHNSAFTPWGGVPDAGDALYVGHSGVLWDTLQLTIDTGAMAIASGVWEYYDGNYNDATPDTGSVVNNGSYLTLSLNSWLGTENRAGTIVRVKCSLTGQYADELTTYFEGGTNKIDTTDLLGQSTPSTNAGDYIVGSLWNALNGVVDGSSLLTAPGVQSIAYALPQNVDENWIKTSLGAVGDQSEAYWMRFRVVSASGATSPTISGVDITSGKQYVLSRGTQGLSETDDPLGSSTELGGQRFPLGAYPVIDDDTLQVFVTEGGIESEWTRVEHFLNSSGAQKHFVVLFDNDGRAIIEFGDGVNGKIPMAGVDNIRCTYRVLPIQEGNVGPNSIVVNRAGVGHINSVTNPRAMAGYNIAEGSTETDLARVKIAGPASIRVLGRGVAPSDIVTLTTAFVNGDGVVPFVRALAIEEGYGPKTIQLVVVGANSSAAEPDYLEELELYFNGDVESGVAGVLLLNTHLTAVNFTPHPINVTAVVDGGNLTAIQNALTSLLSPTAQAADGGWEWAFGEEVPVSRIIATIMGASPAPRKVTLSEPASDVSLAFNELPTLGTLNIIVS